VKKIINSPNDIVQEMLEGYVQANKDKLCFSDSSSYVIKKRSINNKVGIVIGGGSGHEPLFMGYVGKGLADAAVIGNVFAAPTPDSILAAIKEVDCGQGVICIFGNYSGDVLNFEMAKDLAEMENIKVENIVIKDDVASAPKEEKNNRRGIAGDVYMIKMLGAASEKGYSFAECIRLGEKVSGSLYSIGVGFNPGTNPVNGEPGFYLSEGMMEFGLGIHGEPGIEQRKIASANDISRMLINYLIEEITQTTLKKTAICVNGLGSITLMELYIVANNSRRFFEEFDFQVSDMLVGSFCTTQEMNGLSITALLLDKELEELLNEKAISPHFCKGV